MSVVGVGIIATPLGELSSEIGPPLLDAVRRCWELPFVTETFKLEIGNLGVDHGGHPMQVFELRVPRRLNPAGLNQRV